MSFINLQTEVGTGKAVSRGETVSQDAIAELKDSLSCEILVRDEAADDVYRKAIQRFNEGYVVESVRNFSFFTSPIRFNYLTQIQIRHLSFSVKTRKM